MTGKSCTRSRRIGLNGVTFVEQSLIVELLQEPPECFDVRIFVSDVRMLHVHPISHEVAEVGPLLCVHHHILSALRVVVFNADALADVFFGDAKLFFHAEFHRQTVGIPTGLALHLKSLHGFVTTEHVLDGTCHHMVNTRMAIGRGRTFEENKRRTSLTFGHTAVEQIGSIPFVQHFFINIVKTQLLTHSKLLTHIVLFYTLFNSLQR